MNTPNLPRSFFIPSLALVLTGACASTGAPLPPVPGVDPVDHLIEPGEKHFEHLWQITYRGNNAEGYWSSGGDRICLQREADGAQCDRIFMTDPASGELVAISNGRGVTTCSYFMPGDGAIIFASTQAYHEECPPPVDRSDGYVWPVHPEYDLYVHELGSGAEQRLTDHWGYDAEATVSPLGDRIVFTSDRSGDLELWTCALDGSDPRQVTDKLGYDGGAFFSHDGQRLVFRATRFTQDEVGSEAKYKDLLSKHKIRPHLLDLYTCNVDGSNRRRVTDLGGASWAPYFFPGDRRIIFSSNHHDTAPQKFEFDLFAVNDDGSQLEQVTTYKGFDSFPMFSADGKWLVFASNRGGTEPGETNLFLARWK